MTLQSTRDRGLLQMFKTSGFQKYIQIYSINPVKEFNLKCVLIVKIKELINANNVVKKYFLVKNFKFVPYTNTNGILLAYSRKTST